MSIKRFRTCCGITSRDDVRICQTHVSVHVVANRFVMVFAYVKHTFSTQIPIRLAANRLILVCASDEQLQGLKIKLRGPHLRAQASSSPQPLAKHPLSAHNHTMHQSTRGSMHTIRYAARICTVRKSPKENFARFRIAPASRNALIVCPEYHETQATKVFAHVSG